MSVLSVFKRESNAPDADKIELESLLIELQRYGKPRVGLMSQGWHTSVEMNTTATGVTFEARSDFTHKTPIEAAILCRDRIRSALASLSGSMGDANG